MLSIKITQFEGPLDLLLRLIEQETLDITQVSLAHVTDAYIQRLEEMSARSNPDELADFLVIASKLLLIKSKLLLPSISSEDEEEIRELEAQLKIYQEFFNASKVLEKMVKAGRTVFPRQCSISRPEGIFSPPPRLTAEKLCAVFRAVRQAQEVMPPVHTISLDPRMSLQEKIAEIKLQLQKRIVFYFRAILKSSPSKTEVIISFMALLELVKQRFATCEQNTLFDEIAIHPQEPVPESARGVY